MANKAIRRRYDATVAVGQACDALDESLDQLDAKGYVFLGMTIKAPSEARTDWLVTMKAEIEGKKYVSFVSAFKLAEVIDRAIRQFADGKLQWKEDGYDQQRGR